MADTATRGAPDGAGTASHALRGDVIQALLVWLEHGDEVDRCHSARALGRLRANGAIPALIGRLGDKDVDVCVDAAAALAEIGDRAALAALERTLREDPDPEVKTAAITALGCLAGQAQVPLLMEIARAQPENLEEDPATEWDPWWDMQLSAVRALGQLNAGQAAPVLDALLDSEEGQDIEAELLVALARIEGPGEGCVRTRLGAANARQRRRSTTALARSATAESIQAIGRMLLDRDADVRVAALEAIVTRNAKRFLPAILALFRDTEAMVRDAAVRAAEQLIAGLRPHGQMLENLLGRVQDPDPRVRGTALRALAAVTGDPRVATQIERSLNDPDPGVQEAACSLAAVHPPLAVDTRLLAIVADDRVAPGSRRAAVRALGARGCWNQEVAREFSRILATPRAEIRLAVLESLVQLEASTRAGAPAADQALVEPLALVLAALRGEFLIADPPQADSKAHSGADIPVETLGVAQQIKPLALADLPAPGEANIRPAKSSLEAIAIDNAEVALALAEHEACEPAAAEIDAETAQYVALTEKNEEIARWLFAREGLEQDLNIRRLAARALKRCAFEPVATALIEALGESDPKLRFEAAAALAEIAAQPAVRKVLAQANEQLVALAASEDRNARLMAIRIRVRAGMAAAEVEFQALKDAEVVVRIEALRALAAGHQAGSSGAAVEARARLFDAVSGCLADPAPEVRLAAAQAATRIATRIAAMSAAPLLPARELATAIIDAVFAGGGVRVREFARSLRAWDRETAGAVCLARLATLVHSTERRIAIELLEELYSDNPGAVANAATTPFNH